MAVCWSCPVEITDGVAMCVQSMLANLDSFELTDENFEAFCQYNDKAMLLVKDGKPAAHDALKPLIGFRYSH